MVDLEVHFDQSVAPGLSFGPIMKLLISQSLKLMVTYVYVYVYFLFVYIHIFMHNSIHVTYPKGGRAE